jgi:hypothetical protein
MITEEHKGDDGYLHHYESDDDQFWWYVKDGQLSFRIDGTDWQDFVVEDRRAYDNREYYLFMSLLMGSW